MHFAGNVVSANPGTSDKSWNADLTGAGEETALFLLRQILGMRPFLSDAVLALETAKREKTLEALSGIARSISEGPDTGGGVQLRRFLWSLYNGHHLINLWRMTAVLDSEHSRWASEIFFGALAGLLTENDLKQALNLSGEMKRWESELPGNAALEKLDYAETAVRAPMNTLPPCHAHTELAAILSQLARVKHDASEMNHTARGSARP